MSKRKADDESTADMEREEEGEAPSTKAKMTRLELESHGVPTTSSSSSSSSSSCSPPAPQGAPIEANAILPMPSSLREFPRQFEDADAPDLALEAMTLLEKKWNGHEEYPPLARAIKDGSAELEEMFSKYIETVPEENAFMVGGDAFDAAKFTSDARAAYSALKSLDFAKLGTIQYEHIYSAMDIEGEHGIEGEHHGGYFMSKYDFLGTNVRVVADLCRDIVELTETLRKRNGRRIAIDMAEVTKLNESRKAGFFFTRDDADEEERALGACEVIRVMTSGVLPGYGYGTSLHIYNDITQAYLPNDAISLAYIKVENLMSGSTWRTAEGGLAVKDRPPLNYKVDRRELLPMDEIDWDSLYGKSSDNSLLTPGMAAHMCKILQRYTGDAGIPEPEGSLFYDYYVNKYLPWELPVEASPFFRRSIEWRDKYIECHKSIEMRLQTGLHPLTNCYGENVALHGVMYNMGDNTHDIEHDIVFNDTNTLELYRHPNMWFSAFLFAGEPNITSHFAPKARNISQARRISSAADPIVRKVGDIVHKRGKLVRLFSVNVHPTVRAIEDEAFCRWSHLTTANLGEGLEEIGVAAFYECSSLQEIKIPTAVKAIEDYTFCRCSQMTAANLGEVVEEIGVGAFYECSSLQEIKIPHTVKAIKDFAFCGCSNLTTATLDKGLGEIGKGAFSQCNSLQEIILPPALKAIKEFTFYQCSKMTSVMLSEGLEEIGVSAFRSCTILQEISIPAAVKVIEDHAFYRCSQMTRVILGQGLEEIGEAAFRLCTSLQEISIPEAVKAIKNCAFYRCLQMTRVILGQRLEEIGESAFRLCTSLQEISIPAAVKVIKDHVFTNCSQLAIVSLCEGLEVIGAGALQECTSLREILIPNTVKAIKRSAFSQCSKLTTAILGKELEIGVGAFQECTSLHEILIPNAVAAIADKAFYRCSEMNRVILGQGLEEIREEAFGECTSLQEILIPPAVKVIKDRAFVRCSQMTTVILGEGLEDINVEAFCDCTSLQGILIPQAVKVISAEAFIGCSQMTTVILGKGLEKIGWRAFAHCTSLPEILIPHAVKVIEFEAFRGCSQLARVILGEGLKEIAREAFRECTSLSEIKIPPDVKVIKIDTFNGCSSLTSVILGEGLEEIEKNSFRDCTSLQEIRIPQAVKVIHDSAFSGCFNLTRVLFCDEIEKFVSAESMRDWWNHGIHEKSLSTYCFLVKFNIPKRMDLLRIYEWQINIHGLLTRIPHLSSETRITYSPYTVHNDMISCFDSIDSKIAHYEHNLEDTPMLLEMAIWKSKITDQLSQNTADMKIQCRSDSLPMVNIIVRNVLSFL